MCGFASFSTFQQLCWLVGLSHIQRPIRGVVGHSVVVVRLSLDIGKVLTNLLILLHEPNTFLRVSFENL